VRAVLDVNVLISSVVARGAPRELLVRWRDGVFELVVSTRLVDELARGMAYPRIRARISADEADGLVRLLTRASIVAGDPSDPPAITSRDPADDYLIALAAATRSILVTGDSDLLALADRIPVMSPRAFLDSLEGGG
jgi:putative PIN family toxin of toxin-antitoxin system